MHACMDLAGVGREPSNPLLVAARFADWDAILQYSEEQVRVACMRMQRLPGRVAGGGKPSHGMCQRVASCA